MLLRKKIPCDRFVNSGMYSPHVCLIYYFFLLSLLSICRHFYSYKFATLLCELPLFVSLFLFFVIVSFLTSFFLLLFHQICIFLLPLKHNFIESASYLPCLFSPVAFLCLYFSSSFCFRFIPTALYVFHFTVHIICFIIGLLIFRVFSSSRFYQIFYLICLRLLLSSPCLSFKSLSSLPCWHFLFPITAVLPADLDAPVEQCIQSAGC
jgi:hypothetical protein